MMDDIFGDGTSTNCFRRFMQMCCLLRVNSLFPMANESSKSSMHNNDLVIVNISRKLNYYQSKSRSITHKKFSKQNAVLGREKPTQFYTR